MKRNKYLILVENADTAGIVKNVYEQKGESFQFDADFECVDCDAENIRNMIESNKYDAVVNACAPTDNGDSKFNTAIQTFGMTRYRAERIYLFDLDDSLIESELMTLNEY